MLYEMILKARDRAYRKGRRKVFSPAVPTVCVGNITVGGTGKTPHTEMILRELLASPLWQERSIAVLSRGYKRKSKGWYEVQTDSTAVLAGDEPLQMKRNFPGVRVAVHKNRIEGLAKLTEPSATEDTAAQSGALKPEPAQASPADIIILDDAFQYRRLKAGLSVVLVDYNRPTSNDTLLPFGRLRDLPERLFDADIVIVTKCPDLYPGQKSDFALKLGFTAYDADSLTGICPDGRAIPVLFSSLEYGHPKPVFPEGDAHYNYSPDMLVVSGIANPEPLRRYVGDAHRVDASVKFPDHHAFSRKDIRKIEKLLRRFPTAGVITTQKDAQRFEGCRHASDALKRRLFYLPIEVKFLSEEERALFVERLESLGQARVQTDDLTR